MKKQYVIIFAVLVLALLIYVAVSEGTKPGKLDTFAQCLKEREAIFYGTFWCPHCQTQKAMFGNSAHLLAYVECSPANGNGQLLACAQKEIANYPTWIFADGSRETGEISLQTLSQKTGCLLP